MEPVILDKLNKLEIAKGIDGRIVTTATVTFAHVKLKKCALLPEHAHYHEKVGNVIEGELELVVDGKSHFLKPGLVMILQANVPHSGKALTDCRVIDVFHPIREDFRGAGFVGYKKNK